MSKKAKIITGIATAVVVITVLIIGIILATGKKFDMSNYDKVKFNEHTKAFEVNLEKSNYNNSDDTNYYSSGTQIVTPITDVSKFGLFSYTQNKLVVPTIYDEKLVLADRVSDDRSYFLFKSAEHKEELNVFDHNGNRIEILDIDDATHKTIGKIMVKDIEYKDNKQSITANIKSKHIEETIIVKSINYDNSYYMEGEYHYEVWTLEDENGAMYNNLYEVNKGGKRKLIQTLNGTKGHIIDSNTGLNLKILNNGTPIFLSGDLTSIEGLTIYDIDYKKKGTLRFNENLLQNAEYVHFSLGNDLYYQFIIPTNEEDYDLAIPNQVGILQYYQIETYKANLANAELQKTNVEFLIRNATYINSRTTLAKIQYIKDCTLCDIETVLINNKFQILEIDYEFSNITKLSNERYLAFNPYSNICYIINEDYELISTINNYESIFTTSNAIVFSDGSQQYVCNFDGIIMNKYSAGTLSNIHNKDYYLVTKEKQDSEDNSITITKTYLENLGLTEETPLHTSVSNEEKYSYKNTEYSYFNYYSGIDDKDTPTHLDDEVVANLIIRGKEIENTGMMTYEFYSMEDTLLYTAEEKSKDSINHLNIVYSDEDYVIINYNTNKIVIDR